jgi:hypothetical protein
LHWPVSLDRGLELVTVWVLAVSGVGLALAFAGQFQALQVVLVASLATLGYAIRFPGDGKAPTAATSRHLLLLVLVALVFRLPPFNYVLGGQDEGVYFNAAAHLVSSGGITPSDTVLDKLASTAAGNRYIAENYRPTIYLPGVYRSQEAVPTLQFQFYHLFAVWMAVFGGLFGIFNEVHGLTFLALLSVIFVYALSLRISGKPSVALAAGLLLAVNPLHAFFSRFPVSEVPALAFSSMGFAMLVGYWNAAAHERRTRWLVLSVLAFGCLFATRISGFMYLPFVLAVSAASLLCDPDRTRARAMHWWSIGVVGLYAASVAHGLAWSGRYSIDIYNLSFGSLLGPRWPGILALATAAILAVWGFVWVASGSPRLRSILGRVVDVASRWVGPLTLLVFAAGLYRGYLLGFTDHDQSDPWVGLRWHLAGEGWRSFRATSMVVVAMYVCPLLLAAYLWVCQRKSGNPVLDMLAVFLLGFAANFALLQWFVPYQPYFARYLLSEFVPYMLVLVACGWGAARTATARKTLLAAILASGVYAVALSAAQYGKQDNAGAREFLARVTRPVGDDDVLMLDTSGAQYSVDAVKTGMVFAFGKSVMNISEASLKDDAYVAQVAGAFDDVYLLTPLSSAPAGFDFVEGERLRIAGFNASLHPPLRVSSQVDVPLYLYRLRARFGRGSTIGFGRGGAGAGWLGSGWSSPEPWGVWSMGNSASVRIDTREMMLGNDGLTLQLQATGYVNPSHPRQTVRMSVNSGPVQSVEFRYPDQASRTIDIAVDSRTLASSGLLDIEFQIPDAVSPRSLGSGNDDRLLGIGLKTAQVSTGH